MGVRSSGGFVKPGPESLWVSEVLIDLENRALKACEIVTMGDRARSTAWRPLLVWITGTAAKAKRPRGYQPDNLWTVVARAALGVGPGSDPC